MRWGNSATHWGLFSRLLHWFTAVAVLFMLGLGFTMINMRLSPMKLEMFIVHKSIGMLLLVIICIRVVWRLLNPAPRPSSHLSKSQRKLVFLGQLLMYVLLFAIPVSGWVINSASNFPLQWFGLFEIPPITNPSIAVEDYAKTVHFVLICILASVVIMHVTAALHHHWIKRNDILKRML